MERLGCKYLKRVLGICVRRGIINMRLAIIEFIVWLSERLQPRLIGDFHFTSFLFCYYLIKSLINIMSSLLNKNWWGQSRWILFCFSSSIKSRSYVFIQLLYDTTWLLSVPTQFAPKRIALPGIQWNPLLLFCPTFLSN